MGIVVQLLITVVLDVKVARTHKTIQYLVMSFFFMSTRLFPLGILELHTCQSSVFNCVGPKITNKQPNVFSKARLHPSKLLGMNLPILSFFMQMAKPFAGLIIQAFINKARYTLVNC